jgi:hypothetical protein
MPTTDTGPDTQKPRGSSAEASPSRGSAEVDHVHSCPDLASFPTPSGAPHPRSGPKPFPLTGPTPCDRSRRLRCPWDRSPWGGRPPWGERPVALRGLGSLSRRSPSAEAAGETAQVSLRRSARFPGDVSEEPPCRTLRALTLRANANLEPFARRVQPRSLLGFRVLRAVFAERPRSGISVPHASRSPQTCHALAVQS